MMTTKEDRVVSAKFPEWTPWTEAISFVSATLGDVFITATGNGLYWSPFESTNYPVALERVGDKVKVIVDHQDTHVRSEMIKLWAIIGWAYTTGHVLEVVD